MKWTTKLPDNPGDAHQWRRWAAECRLMNVEPEGVARRLRDQGLDADRELADMTSDPCFQAGEGIAQRLRKLESLLDVYTQLTALGADLATVDRRRGLSRTQFLGEYYSRNRPVVLDGLIDDWPALARWSPAYLAAACGNAVVEVMDGREGPSAAAQYAAGRQRSLPLAEFVSLVCSSTPTNRFCIVSANDFLQRPDVALLWDDIGNLPEYLDESRRHIDASFWFGPAGTITPLHHDLMNILFTQVYGRKEFRLIPSSQTHLVANEHSVFSAVDAEHPDFERFPRFAETKCATVVIRPGDALFIPVGWWHHVRALDICISVSFTNFVFPNDYTWRNPSIDCARPAAACASPFEPGGDVV